VAEPCPFDTLESSFRLLCVGPSPLVVDGREIGPPFPGRPIPLAELAGMLLHPSTSLGARARAMRLLVGRAKECGGVWTVGLAGVLLPGLRAALAPLMREWPGDAADLQAETLAALVETLTVCDPNAELLAAKLVWRVTMRAKRRLERELAARGRPVSWPTSSEPHRPWGHPDFVLAAAVRAEVLSAEDAELIGETRLGGTSLHAYAQARGAPDGTLRMRRMRAERRLVSWVRGRDV
jgi:hypothetical protein